MSLYGRHRLAVGRPTDLMLAVGTPGVGPVTMAWVGYEKLIPEGAFPIAQFEYAPPRAGDSPLKELYELKDRC